MGIGMPSLKNRREIAGCCRIVLTESRSHLMISLALFWFFSVNPLCYDGLSIFFKGIGPRRTEWPCDFSFF
jgi:hypothetical protein